MKNAKIFIAIVIALVALTTAKAQDVVNRKTYFNNTVAFRQGNPGTNANRLMGVSAAGPGATGSFMNYVTIGSGLSLASGVLSSTGGGSVDTTNFWNTRGNTITGNKWLGTNENRSLHIRTNATEYALIDSTGRIRFGATNTLPLFNSTAQAQTHLATNGAYTIRSTSGPIVLQATGTEGVCIGAATADTNKLYVLGSTYLEGSLRIVDGSESNGYVLTSDANGNANWQAAAGGWGLTGNAGTNPATNFIGTTDQPLAIKSNDSLIISIEGADNKFTISTYNQSGVTTDGAEVYGNGNSLILTSKVSNAPQGQIEIDSYLKFFTANTERATILNNGNVGIGTGTPAAILDVTSTTSGFLPPRMTGAERDAIATPINGMILYNSTTDKLQVRAAGAWVDLH